MAELDINKQLEKMRGAISKQLRESVNDIRLDALYQQLLMSHVFGRPEPLAAMTGWSVAPEFGWWLYNYVKDKSPRKIVELGSGVSTLIIASALQRSGGGRIVSFESDLDYCRKTESLLQLCGLDGFAEVIYAPLREYEIGGQVYRWYSVPFDLLDVFSGAEGIDLLLIDGPPKSTNFHARYPAYPLLRRYFHNGTMLVLDDAQREEETQILERWLSEAPGDFVVERLADVRHGPALFYPQSTVKDADVSKLESIFPQNPVLELIVAEVRRLSARGMLDLKSLEPLERSFSPLVEGFYFFREKSLEQVKLESAQAGLECKKLQALLDSEKASSEECRKASEKLREQCVVLQNDYEALEAEKDELLSAIEEHRAAREFAEENLAGVSEAVASLREEREHYLNQQAELTQVYDSLAQRDLELKELREASGIAAAESDGLRLQVKGLEERLEYADTMIGELSGSLASVQERLVETVALNERLRDEVSSLTERNSILEVELIRKIAEELSLRGELGKLVEYEADIKRRMNRAKKSDASLKEAQAKILQCELVIAQYEQKLRCANSESVLLSYRLKGHYLSAEYVKCSLAYQLGRTLVTQGQSPMGLFKLPLAAYRVVRRHKQNKPKFASLLRRIEKNSKDAEKAKKMIVEGGSGANLSIPLGGRDAPASAYAWGATADLCRIALQEKNRRSLVKTVLRTSSLQGRELVAYLASDGEFGLEDIVRAVEAYRDPALQVHGVEMFKRLSVEWFSNLARVMAYQLFLPDDRINAYTILRGLVEVQGERCLSKEALGVLAVLSVDFKDVGFASRLINSSRLDETLSRFLRLDCLNPIMGGQEGEWLAALNELMGSYQLAPVGLTDNSVGSPFSRLRCSVSHRVENGPLVAVVVTAWCPGEDLYLSVRSILAQTWRNLEVIIVNDASPSEFHEVFEQCEKMDSRVRVIHQEINQGTYMARNAALSQTAADYVTFQDSDDWSHPARIEAQVNTLQEHKQLVAVHGYALSLSEDMRFCRAGRPILHSNASSLMFRRQLVLAKIGFMDSVRKGADTEYALRIKLAFGEEAFGTLELPLSFIRLSSGSLSRDEFRAGWQHPARRAYKSAYGYWHGLIRAGQASPYRKLGGERAFPAPLRFQIDRTMAANAHYDVIFIGDWRHYGGPQKSMIEEIKALHCSGKRLAICTLEAYRFMRGKSHDICAPIVELIHSGVVDQVLLDDALSVGLVLLRYPPILQVIPYVQVNWKISSARIVANQAPHEKDGSDVRYHVADCIKNARELFGFDPIWVPQGPIVREALAPLLPPALLEAGNNPGILNIAEWYRERSAWVGARPVLGRYSRDNALKFPATEALLCHAYMADEDVSVRLMGGVKSIPALMTRELPGNWELIPYGEEPVESFLQSIDFFVYFDNESIVEAFGRSVLEALASGVVVILPHRFNEVFGEAAVYCKEAEVASVVRDFYSNKEKYLAQSREAYRLLCERFSYESFQRYVQSALVAGK